MREAPLALVFVLTGCSLGSLDELTEGGQAGAGGVTEGTGGARAGSVGTDGGTSSSGAGALSGGTHTAGAGGAPSGGLSAGGAGGATGGLTASDGGTTTIGGTGPSGGTTPRGGTTGSGGAARGGTASGGTTSGGTASGGTTPRGGTTASGGTGTGGTGTKLPRGSACTSPSQCDSTFCADGVCCDSACSSQICQRCDADSIHGAGTCGPAKAGTNRDRDCAEPVTSCDGKCRLQTVTSSCTGAYRCASSTQTTNVPSGSVCVDGSTLVTPVSKTAYCDTGEDCVDGACSATRWWTSCNGAGSCRVGSDQTNAFTEPVYAAVGSTLSDTCGTSARLCSTAAHCYGGTQYSGYACTAAHNCKADAGPLGCCTDCGEYACGGSACYANCQTDSHCASGSYCVTTVAPMNTCSSGALNARCDVPMTLTSPGNDCDTGLVCTSDKYCKRGLGAACTTSAECGQGNIGMTIKTLICSNWSAYCPSGGTCCGGD